MRWGPGGVPEEGLPELTESTAAAEEGRGREKQREGLRAAGTVGAQAALGEELWGRPRES